MRKIVGAGFLLGGGAATLGALWYVNKKSEETVDAIKKAVEGPALPAMPGKKYPSFNARLTGYWPYQPGLSAAERKMEGGTRDRKSRPIIVLEDHLENPSKYPYVSVAADYTVFPDGQRLIIPEWPGAVFRVVDTGGHFFGSKKVYRAQGYEPLDIAVRSSKTSVPKLVSVQIVPGDHWAKKGLTEVATSGMKGQTVSLTGDVVEARTVEDYEALARALESELSGRSREEMLAAAWAIRNRADERGVSVNFMLAPLGKYGSPSVSKGYASTRKAPTDKSKQVAATVLDEASENDPTGGAVEFWVPEHQTKMRRLGDVHRAAVSSGDDEKAKKYERYAGYMSEGDVRVQHVSDGLQVIDVIGAVEILGRFRGAL